MNFYKINNFKILRKIKHVRKHKILKLTDERGVDLEVDTEHPHP